MDLDGECFFDAWSGKRIQYYENRITWFVSQPNSIAGFLVFSEPKFVSCLATKAGQNRVSGWFDSVEYNLSRPRLRIPLNSDFILPRGMTDPTKVRLRASWREGVEACWKSMYIWTCLPLHISIHAAVCRLASQFGYSTTNPQSNKSASTSDPRGSESNRPWRISTIIPPSASSTNLCERREISTTHRFQLSRVIFRQELVYQ